MTMSGTNGKKKTMSKTLVRYPIKIKTNDEKEIFDYSEDNNLMNVLIK